MWQEARRQERKIRGMLVDYRKRADRRREYYEKIKLEPTQFLQIHGQQCKIHLDQNVSSAVDNAVMVPWKDQTDNLIDRFDVRAHLDYIPAVAKEEPEILTQEERLLNYERYRIIAQNSFLRIPEEKCLKQLNLEEQFGYTEVKCRKGTAIGYNYEDNTGSKDNINVVEEIIGESDDEYSDSDFDVDLAINVSKMDPIQANEINKHGCNFGMSSNDFYSFLINDLEEAEALKLAREEEQEKALYAGRKSRRERRYYRERMLANRIITSPTYATKVSPEKSNFSGDRSRSRSSSPECSGKITYITSFGGDEEVPSTSKVTDSSVKSGKQSRHGNLKSKEKSYRNSGARCRLKRSRSRSRETGCYSSRDGKYRKATFLAKRYQSNCKSHRSRKKSSSSSSTSNSSSTRSSRSRDQRSHHSRNYSHSSTSSLKTQPESPESDKEISKNKTKHESNKIKTPELNKIPEERIQSKASAPSVIQTLPRYYGRRKSKDCTSSSDSRSTSEESNKKNSTDVGKKSTPNKTVIELLKKKRQALLNRQFRADKKAAQLKMERDRLEQQIREDELREMAVKLRKRQREQRRVNYSSSSSCSESSSRSCGSRTSISRGKYGKDKERKGDRKKCEYRRDSRDREDSRRSKELHIQRRADTQFKRDRDSSTGGGFKEDSKVRNKVEKEYK